MEPSFDIQCRDNEFCMKKILEVRGMFGNKNSTEADFDDAMRTLGFILLCNQDKTVANLVNSTLHEMALRQTYFMMNIWPFKEIKEKEALEIRYFQWPNGKHWYAKVGTEDVVDKNGNQKWDTYKEAEKAAKWYVKQ